MGSGGGHAYSIRDFMEGDEISRVTKDNQLQFGKILCEHPSHGTFTVQWKSKTDPPITINAYKPTEDKFVQVKLIDRRHPEGGMVVHMEDNRIGEILDTKLCATVYSPQYNEIIENVPLELLRTVSLFTGELIEYQGWIGKVSSVVWLVSLEYDDGIQCNVLMTQVLQTNTSFGFETYPKSSPPCTAIKIIPTAKEYATAEWKGVSFFDTINQLNDEHRNKSGTVIGVEISTVNVKWLIPTSSDQDLPIPPLKIEGDKEIEKIKDFDFSYQQWYRKHSLCEYIVREGDELTHGDDMEKAFCAYLKEGKEDAQEPPAKQRKVEKRKLKLEVGTAVMVEVIRIRHTYRVIWSGPGKSESAAEIGIEVGSLLSPCTSIVMHTPYGFENQENYVREFVTVKHPESFSSDEEISLDSIFGVTHHRNLRDELITVDWYQDEGPGLEEVFLCSYAMSSYELISHSKYKGLKPDAIVKVKDGENSSVGMVVRVTKRGMVEVYLGVEKSVLTFSPSDLQTINLPIECKHQKPSNNETGIVPPSSLLLNNDNVEMVECIANDLREILDSERDDIMVKKYHPADWDTLSVLMKGPPDTPYENGLFLFHVVYPPNYPHSPPSVCWVNLPKGESFIAFNLSSKTGEVFHPMFNNWLGNEKGGWSKRYSLLDLLDFIQEDIFVREPYFSQASLHFKTEKEKAMLPTLNRNVLGKMTIMNASVVITVFDMLTDLGIKPPVLWRDEIAQHILKAFPEFKNKFETWFQSPIGIFADLKDYPKYHIFPISTGLSQALGRRIKILDTAAVSALNVNNASDDKGGGGDDDEDGGDGDGGDGDGGDEDDEDMGDDDDDDGDGTGGGDD